VRPTVVETESSKRPVTTDAMSLATMVVVIVAEFVSVFVVRVDVVRVDAVRVEVDVVADVVLEVVLVGVVLVLVSVVVTNTHVGKVPVKSPSARQVKLFTPPSHRSAHHTEHLLSVPAPVQLCSYWAPIGML